jgi:lipid-A-disaccharide synthase
VEYISLVNLIASREVVKELMADTFSVKNIREVLGTLLTGSPERNTMLSGYEEVRSILGDMSAPNTAASLIVSFLSRCKKDNG